jgi:hypothetical protein
MKAFMLAGVVVATVAAWSPRAHATFTCQIGFQDSTGLSLLDPGTVHYEGEKAGILAPSCDRQTSKPFGCVPGAFQLWYYELCNGLIWFYFDENPGTSYEHFHQMPEDLTIGACYTQDNTGAFVFGRLVNGTCTSAGINPLTTPRFISTHLPDQFMRVVNNSNSSTFRPTQILVKPGSDPVSVSFIDTNNTFWTYHNLTPGPNGTWWTLNPTGTFGSVIFIGDDGGIFSATFDNLSIQVNQ